jgi:hypothetical protein
MGEKRLHRTHLNADAASGANSGSVGRDGVAAASRLRVEGPYERTNVGVELKGVRSGVERRRGVSGLKARDPGRRETNAGR